MKKVKQTLLIVCLIILCTFPDKVSAGIYEDAYAFYQKHGNEMTFISGSNNDGEIYYATKAKTASTAKIRYSTLGWQVRVFNPEGVLMDTLYYKLDGNGMVRVDKCTKDGYVYYLYRVSLKNLKSRLSDVAIEELNHPGCNIIFDACTTTKIDGVVQGGMSDEGPEWGKVYTSYNGIVNAQNWSSSARESLKSYYNKTVNGLFFNVSIETSTGIRKVTGEGRYLFGSSVNVVAELEDGYHFDGWSGSRNSDSKSFSFVLYDKDVLLVAKASENKYTIKFHANGGTGSIDSQVCTYFDICQLPSHGYVKDGATTSGWTIDEENLTTQYYKGQQVRIKDLVHQLGIENIDGATICFYAAWDHGPQILTDVIYVPLDYAKQGLITEAWLAQKAKALDQEDGEIPYGKNETTSFLLENYKETDFTFFASEGMVTESFLAKDSAGNETKKQIKVYIVDTGIYDLQVIQGRLRFISKKYFWDEDRMLVEEKLGGLGETSVWRLDEEFRETLEILFSK